MRSNNQHGLWVQGPRLCRRFIRGTGVRFAWLPGGPWGARRVLRAESVNQVLRSFFCSICHGVLGCVGIDKLCFENFSCWSQSIRRFLLMSPRLCLFIDASKAVFCWCPQSASFFEMFDIKLSIALLVFLSRWGSSTSQNIVWRLQMKEVTWNRRGFKRQSKRQYCQEPKTSACCVAL